MIPFLSVLEKLIEQGFAPSRTSTGCYVTCPVHEADRVSLLITEDSKGMAVFKCNAGCSDRDIFGAWGFATDHIALAHSEPEQGLAVHMDSQSDRRNHMTSLYEPFPLDALPEPIRSYVSEGAQSIDCDPSYIALPLLSALGTSIGNTYRLMLKRAWPVPPVLWTAIVGESGTSKTPAFNAALKFLRKHQELAYQNFGEANKEYEAELAEFDKSHSARKPNGGDQAPPAKLKPPICDRYLATDTTMEALTAILAENPRGLLMDCDELSGWFSSFDRYKSGKGGGDAANWLLMYNGRQIYVDRKTGNPPQLYIPRASVSITGGIQPRILRRALGDEHRESGLAARFLFAQPPRRTKSWSDADISITQDALMEEVFDRLLQIDLQYDERGNLNPRKATLTDDAKTIYTSFYNDHGQEHTELTGDLSAAWSKLEEIPARLALILHLSRWAAKTSPSVMPGLIDRESMESAIRLTEWFKRETTRVYRILKESESQQQLRNYVEWIERKGGAVTIRELQQGRRDIDSAHKAKTVLDGLVSAGFGTWEDSPEGVRGQPTRRFVLSQRPTINAADPPAAAPPNTVDVDSVNEMLDASNDDDWGEA